MQLSKIDEKVHLSLMISSVNPQKKINITITSIAQLDFTGSDFIVTFSKLDVLVF
jgi:hypothetical protein